MIGFKVTDEMRDLVRKLVAVLSMRRKQRHTMTDIIIESLVEKAQREKVK